DVCSSDLNISAGETRPRMHESNQLAHIPCHVGRCSVLTYFAVYRQCQTQLGRTLWKLILGDNPRPYTRGAILAFGRKQIHANTFGTAALQISRTDVIAHGIAEHAGKRVLQIDLAAADHGNQFHLMIQLLGERREANWIIWANQGAVGLEEGYWLDGCVKSEIILQMFQVVSTRYHDAIDRIDWRQEHDFRHRNWLGGQ